MTTRPSFLSAEKRLTFQLIENNLPVRLKRPRAFNKGLLSLSRSESANSENYETLLVQVFLKPGATSTAHRHNKGEDKHGSN
jgi:hypothetical protein